MSYGLNENAHVESARSFDSGPVQVVDEIPVEVHLIEFAGAKSSQAFVKIGLHHIQAAAHAIQHIPGIQFHAHQSMGDVILDPFFGSGTTVAVAKKLGRNWIGIERDKKYVKVAQKRIDAVAEADSEAINVEKPRQARVPFGALLESGFLSVGQSLFFAKNGTKAKILSNGHIKCGDITDSIHGVARSLMNGAPVNSWDAWHYKDENDKRQPLDNLRSKFREINK